MSMVTHDQSGVPDSPRAHESSRPASDASESREPRYGQVRVPKYGASASSYPDSYDPYIYGAPDGESAGGSVGGRRDAGPVPAVEAPQRPQQEPSPNPFEGRLDVYGPISLILALLGVPILPAIMGLMCMWRTRRFHMRGFGWGLAAVIINVLSLMLGIWLVQQGFTTDQLWSLVTGSGSTGSGSDMVSA